MKIQVQVVSPEIADSIKSGFYEVDEGATVRDLFSVCQKENSIHIKEEYLKWLSFLTDGKSATWDTLLENVKKVHILRAAWGG